MSAIFSGDADSILSRAKSIAHEASHEYVGTDHIFAAICERGVVVLSEFLTRRSISVATVIEKVREMGFGRVFPASELPFTPKAKDVLCRAIRLTHCFPVTAERILYAILEGACRAKGNDGTVWLLTRLGISVSEMHSLLQRIEPPTCWPPDDPPLRAGQGE